VFDDYETKLVVDVDVDGDGVIFSFYMYVPDSMSDKKRLDLAHERTFEKYGGYNSLSIQEDW